MDGDTCPPYWPEIIWWLLHHHGPPPPPPDNLAEFDRLFAHVAILALARQAKDVELAKAATGALERSIEALR
jgi:hypothetical protein